MKGSTLSDTLSDASSSLKRTFTRGASAAVSSKFGWIGLAISVALGAIAMVIISVVLPMDIKGINLLTDAISDHMWYIVTLVVVAAILAFIGFVIGVVLLIRRGSRLQGAIAVIAAIVMVSIGVPAAITTTSLAGEAAVHSNTVAIAKRYNPLTMSREDVDDVTATISRIADNAGMSPQRVWGFIPDSFKDKLPTDVRRAIESRL